VARRLLLPLEGELTNDFFVNILDMRTKWVSIDESEDVYEGRDRRGDKPSRDSDHRS